MQNKKQIVLINPPIAEIPKSQIFVTTIPLGLAYLAAQLIKNKFEVKVIDGLGLALNKRTDWQNLKLRGLTIKEIIAKIPKDTEFICMSANFTPQHKLYLDLVKSLRKNFPKSKIILGGNEATVNYSRYLEGGADYCIMGEAEETLLKLVNAIVEKKAKGIEGLDGIAFKKAGKRKFKPKTSFIKDLDKLAFPARHLFPLENYWKAKSSHGPVNKRFTPIISSRGCPFDCSFCSSAVFWQRQWNSRSPENFVKEMQECIDKFGITEFEIEDDNLTLKLDRAKKIFNLIIEKNLNITWTTPNGVRSEKLDRKTLALMKKSGCVLLVLAPESGSQRILKEVYNKSIDLENIAKVAKDCYDLGIKTTAFFVVGLPVETEQDRNETRAYVKRLARIGVDEIGAFPCMPYPRTEVRKKYFNENTPGIDNLTIGDVPEWYPNHKAVQSYVKELYLTFLLYKTIFHPIKMMKSLVGILSNKQSLKIEREIIRRKNNFFKSISSLFG